MPALVDDSGQAGALLQLAAREGRIVLCADASSDRRVSGAERRRLLDAGQKSALCIPVVSPAGLTAVLGVVWPEAHAASDDDLDLARHLGTAAAAAIDRAETLASERQARARAQELQRIGGLMASNLDAAAVLREIVSQAALLLNADSCALRLVEGDRLVVRAVQGEAAELLAGEQAPLTGGPTGEVLARRTPVAVADMAADDRFLPDDPLVQARFAAYLGAPILSPDGDLRGVLALYDRRRRVWKPDELEALEAFANSATVALQNALLYQRVAQEKDKSEAIIASIADGIVVVDADSRIEMWNRATATMTGVSSRVALRRTLRELLRGELGDHDDAALAALQEAAESGGGVEVRLSRGDREIWLQARAAELRDPVEDRIGTVYALRDVSEDRQLDQLKSDFVATVSHELRTPLTSIYGFAETLLRGDVSFADEDRKTFLGYIASESERLTRLVDGLLSVTRLEAGGVELALEDIDVGDVLREIVVRQAERAKDSHRVDLHLPAGPLVAAADRDKLRQVVLNLVDNAIKYSPDGGTIDVTRDATARHGRDPRARPRHRHLRRRPAQPVPQVLPRRRAHDARHPRHRPRAVPDARLRDRDGRPHPRRVGGRQGLHVHRRPAAAPQLRRRGACRMKVLVVDDEISIRLLCRVNLEAEGFEVFEVGTRADVLPGRALVPARRDPARPDAAGRRPARRVGGGARPARRSRGGHAADRVPLGPRRSARAGGVVDRRPGRLPDEAVQPARARTDAAAHRRRRLADPRRISMAARSATSWPGGRVARSLSATGRSRSGTSASAGNGREPSDETRANEPAPATNDARNRVAIAVRCQAPPSEWSRSLVSAVSYRCLARKRH